MASKKEEEAQTWLEKALFINPDDMLGLLRLAQFRIKSGFVFKTQGTKTRQILRQMSSPAPQSIAALVTLAYFFRARGNLERASSAFQKVLEQHQKNPYARFSYAGWLSKLYDCEREPDAVCSAGTFSTPGKNIDTAALDRFIFAEKNANFCTAIDKAIHCRFRRWSVYATEGV